MRLTDQAMEILVTVGTISGWYVCADNIVFVAELIREGLAEASDDYEGPQLHITEKGNKYLLRKKLIRPDPEAHFSKFSRTETGDGYRQFSLR